MIKTILGVPNLIDTDKIAKALKKMIKERLMTKHNKMVLVASVMAVLIFLIGKFIL